MPVITKYYLGLSGLPLIANHLFWNANKKNMEEIVINYIEFNHPERGIQNVISHLIYMFVTLSCGRLSCNDAFDYIIQNKNQFLSDFESKDLHLVAPVLYYLSLLSRYKIIHEYRAYKEIHDESWDGTVLGFATERK